ncbi:hypothetical protein RB200_05870 [Streptomyces sp. PmtG]
MGDVSTAAEFAGVATDVDDPDPLAVRLAEQGDGTDGFGLCAVGMPGPHVRVVEVAGRAARGPLTATSIAATWSGVRAVKCAKSYRSRLGPTRELC